MDKQAYLDRWPEMSRIVHDVVLAHGGIHFRRTRHRTIEARGHAPHQVTGRARCDARPETRCSTPRAFSIPGKVLPAEVILQQIPSARRRASGGARTFGFGGGALRAMTVGSITK
jgi:hypothetical protein